MSDIRNGDRPSLRPSPRSSARPESLSALLDQPLADEGKVLDALVAGLSSGEATLEHFKRLHDAASAQERTANLSFAYERLARDARVKLLAKPRQVEFLLAATAFFGDVFGDPEAAVGYAERAYQLAPDDPRVFDQLETVLATAQEGGKLAKLYSEKAAREKDIPEKQRLLRAAIELLETFAGSPDDVARLYRQVVDLDPEDKAAFETLEKLYVGARKFKDLAEVLERSVTRAEAERPGSADESRHRLIALYRGELRDPTKAAPHVEALLSREPIGQAALQAAEALVDHRPIAARIAPLLSEAYRRLGRLEDEASTLALELKLARPPRLAEVHRRLAVLRKDVLGDPAGALELLEPLVARDPSDDELRLRYVEVSGTFHREIEAAKLLSRAMGSVKDPAVRIKVGQEIAQLYAGQGDEKRARAVLEPLLDDAVDPATRLAIAKKLSELHADGSDPKGLATALAQVISLESNLPDRVGAAKRLVELCESGSLEPRLAVTGWRALIGSPRTEEALDRLEALYAELGDDNGKIEVLEQRASRSKDPEVARRLAYQAAEIRAFRTKDKAVAVSVLREFLRVHGPHRAALERLSTLLEQQRDFSGLAAAIEQLLDLSPPAEHAPLLSRLSRIRLHELRDTAGALSALRAALALDPKEASARKLAERLLSEGELRKEAADLLEPVYRVEENHAGSARVLETRADLANDPVLCLSALDAAHDIVALKLKDGRRRLEICGRALALAAASRRAALPLWLGRFREAQGGGGEAARAAESLVKALGDLPIDSRELSDLGREAAEALVRAGEVARAVETYRRVLAFEPSSPELLARVDELLAEQGSPEERLALYRAALDRAGSPERRAELLRTIARIQRKDVGDLEGARATLETLAKEVPNDLAVHEALVETYRALGEREPLLLELQRALQFVEGDRRSVVLLGLSREYSAAGARDRALEGYRELVEADELPFECFPEVEALAEAQGDVQMLASVLERAVARAPDELSQAELLERLGDVRVRLLGDTVSAAKAFRTAALATRDMAGQEERARRLYERILDSAPDDLEAARYLLDGAIERGAWPAVPALFSVLLRGDPSHEPVDLLLGLEARASKDGASAEFAAMADEALAQRSSDGPRRARDVMVAKARVLASDPSRVGEAAAVFRGVVEAYGEAEDVALFQSFLDDPARGESAVEDLRWLFAYRVEHATDPTAVLLEWADAEERRMKDPARALRVLEDVLAQNPADTGARDAFVRLGLSRGDAAGVVRTLRAVRDRLSPDDAVEVDVRIASLSTEHLGDASAALPLLRQVLSRVPGHAEAVRVAREALRRPDSRVAAAELLGTVATSTEGAAGAELLRVLLDETRGAEALAQARADWYLRLLDASSGDPATALAVAVEAAEEMPEVSELWDTAERLARRAEAPSRLAEAYQRTLAKPLEPDLGEAIGRRFVEFQEEWFDDADIVLRLLERVLELSPRARWALDRIKLSYNAEGRWDELFALYDRAIAGAADDREREDLLDEAALAAKDLANDAERAIRYLERLVVLRPDVRVEAMLERLYERTGRARELLGLLEKRAGQASGSDLLRLRVRLARLKIDLGDGEAAFGLLEQVLADDADEPAAYELLERISRLPASEPSVPAPKKGAKKKVPRVKKASIRHEAVRILEERYRSRGDRAGIVRALEASLELAETPKERTRRLEELVSICLDELGDVERGFVHLATLVELEPRSPAYRERLAEVASRIGAEHRRAALLSRVADGLSDLAAKVALLREAASVLEAAGELDGASELYSKVLALAADDPKISLDIAGRLEPILGKLGRPSERCNVLELVSRLERDPGRRKTALLSLAEVAFGELSDTDRAIAAYERRLAEEPRDVETMGSLERVLETAGSYSDLAKLLFRRAAVVGRDAGRVDRVRAARLQAVELSDPAAAIATWRAVRKDYGPDDESFDALSALFEAGERWDDLAELYEQAAGTASEAQRTELYRMLGDVHRDRTGKAVRALEAYVQAGDFARTTTIADHVSDREAVKQVAERLLDLAEGAWAKQTVAPDIEEAAFWAVQTLVRKFLEDGAYDRVVAVQLRAASLPFDRTRRRQLRRDAAFVACDRLEDPARAIGILKDLFAEDSADDIALASVTRFARLLDESGRQADLAALWEEQARCRAEAGDRIAAAALWARAAEIWEVRLHDVERAVLVHRKGAALAGEASLEALARIHWDGKNYRAAAMALEWLCAQSTREELPARTLRLADAYIALGEWERARARLEHASATAIDASSVRQRLLELYRQHRVFSPLCELLVAEADRAPNDRARLALLREAADLHVRERNDPAAAVPLLERAVDIDPEDPSLPLSLSQVLCESERFDDAAAVLRRRIEAYGQRRPKDRAIVHLYLARVSLAAGRRAEALSELDIGTKIHPAHPGILYELGRLAFEEGQWTRAERTYRALLLVLRKPGEDASEAPSRAEIYLDLSEIAARQSEAERAAELVESAFEAALDSETDAKALERALKKAGRYDLLARALELRLAAASEPAVAARALSDLVVLHAEHLGDKRDMAGRIEGEAGRIHRDLEARGVGDDGAWAALSGVYEWLGSPEKEAKALEHRVRSLLMEDPVSDVEPVLRLAAIRLEEPAHRDEGVMLVGRALDAGADRERVWRLLRKASESAPGHRGLLLAMERIAREPGREAALVEVMVLLSAAGPVPAGGLREAVELSRSLGNRAGETALLEGALRHSVGDYGPEDAVWVRESLARILIAEGQTARALDLLEQASELAEPEVARALSLEVARAASAGDDLDRAGRLYRTVLSRDPADREAWEPLLEIYRKAGDRERLITLIGETAPLVEAQGDRSRLRLEEATLMLAEPDREGDAIRLLREIVEEDPGIVDAADLLAGILERQGRLGELASLVASQIDVARSQGDSRAVELLGLKLGGLLEREGKPERALEAYGGVLDWNPSSPDALRAIVRLEDAAGRPATEVADTLERLISVEEAQAVAPLVQRLLELRTKDGDWPGVDRALETACAANPEDPVLREQLVARRLEQHDWLGAGHALRRAAEADASDAALLLRAAEAYERSGDLLRATETLGLAMARSPSEPDLYAERSRLFLELDRPDDALADLESAHANGGGRANELVAALEAAIERTEGDVRARHTLRLVELLEELGETTPAREQLVRLIKHQPKHRDALRKLASLAATEARWEEAAATYRRLIPLEQDAALVAAALNLADACEHSGNLGDARGGLERALSELPDSPELRARLRQLYEITRAHKELARLLLSEARAEVDVSSRTATLLRAAELLLDRDGDPELAVEVLEEVRRLVPESIQGAVLLARAQAVLGRGEDALSALEDVVSAHRGRRTKELSLVYREISNVHLEAGALTEALDALSRAFDLDMRNGELAMQLGHLAIDVGDAEVAQKAFRSVTMMRLRQPGSPEGASAEARAVAYYHLSRIAQEQGDYRKARLMASKALTENPQHAEAQALLKELRTS